MASGSDDTTIILWDVASDPTLTTLTAHTDSIVSLAFSSDGTQMASGGGDGTIILWDIATGQPVTTLKGHTRLVWSVAFSPDGTKLASGSDDQQVLIPDEKFFQDPCHWVRRNLSRDEWDNYVSRDLPYQRVCPGLPAPGGN